MADIYCADPVTGRRGLLIEVQADAREVSEATLQAFFQKLFQASIRVGLFMTPEETFVVRDTLSSMKFEDNRFYAVKLWTASLFEKARVGRPSIGAEFQAQVGRWIGAVGESWFHALPPEAVPEMVPDVIGHITGAVVEENRAEDHAW